MSSLSFPSPRAVAAEPRPVLEPAAIFGHLLRISRALAGKLEFQAAIQAVSDELAEVLPHDHLDICILRRDDVHVAYEAGLHTDWGRHLHTVPVRRSPIRSLLVGEVPFLITGNAMEDPRFLFEGAFNDPIFSQRLRSRLHAPLLVRGEVIGAFSCSRHDAGFYALEDVTIAQHVAEMLAPYVYALGAAEEARRLAIEEAEGRAREEGLRDGALRLTEELERERQRIGMDLHDGTLADLTRIARRLERLCEGEAAPREALEPIVDGLQRCMGELRQIIDDARPNVLELFGFAEGVEDFLGRALLEPRTGIAWRLADASEGAVDALPAALRVALFRIVQEAVNNAAQHAGPSLIEVSVERVEEEDGATEIRIGVRDDGVGFMPMQQRRRVGGIRNMQTRARLVSAGFTLQRRADGQGTEMLLVLPVASAAGAVR